MMQEASIRVILHVHEHSDLHEMEGYLCTLPDTNITLRKTEREDHLTHNKTILGFVVVPSRAQTEEFERFAPLYEYLRDKFGEEAITLTESGKNRLRDAGLLDDHHLSEQQRAEVRQLIQEEMASLGAEAARQEVSADD